MVLSLLVANFVGFDGRWRRATVYLEILAEQDQFFDVRHVVSAAKMWSRGLSSLFYFYRAEHEFERGLGPEEELKSGKIWMFFKKKKTYHGYTLLLCYLRYFVICVKRVTLKQEAWKKDECSCNGDPAHLVMRATNATSEWSFSTVHWFKTYLRASDYVMSKSA